MAVLAFILQRGLRAALGTWFCRRWVGTPHHAWTEVGDAHPRNTSARKRDQFEIAITRLCGSGVPFNKKVSGTVSLAATLGTTTLN